MRLHVEKRLESPSWMKVVFPILSLILALLLGALLILLTGNDPLGVYKSMLLGTFGSGYALSETVVKAIPLMLASGKP